MSPLGEDEEEVPQAVVKPVGAEHVEDPDLPTAEDVDGDIHHPAGQDLPCGLPWEAEQLEEVLQEHGTTLGARGGREHHGAEVGIGTAMSVLHR